MKKVVSLVILLVFWMLVEADEEEQLPCNNPSRPITLSEVQRKWYVVEMRSDVDISLSIYCRSMTFQAHPTEPNLLIVTATWHNSTGPTQERNFNLTRANSAGEYEGGGDTARFYHLTDDSQILLICLYVRNMGTMLFALSQNATQDKSALQTVVDSLPPPGYQAPIRFSRGEECNRPIPANK